VTGHFEDENEDEDERRATGLNHTLKPSTLDESARKGDGSKTSMNTHRLNETRDALLNLHKALVDSERVRYEKVVGEIKSPSHFLQLVTNDPWFAWLHPLSQLIVSIDEAVEDEKALTSEVVAALMRQATELLAPQESGHDFGGHYFEALQNDPNVVLAHAAATKIIGRKTPSANPGN
jgi:hypothetical protein